MLRYLAALLVVVRAVSGQATTDSFGSLSISTSSPTIIATDPTTTPGATSVMGITAVGSSSSAGLPSASTSVAYSCVTTVSAIGPFVTIYNLVFVDVCPTGIIYNTYTITDTCGCTHSTDYTRPTGCPSGFTVTNKVCTACPGAPTITVTVPINSANSAAQVSQTYKPTTYANSNSNSTPAYTAGSAGSPGSPGVLGVPGTPSAPRSSGSGTAGAKPSVVTTGAATAISSSSILGSFLVLTMTLVAGLMWVL